MRFQLKGFLCRRGDRAFRSPLLLAALLSALSARLRSSASGCCAEAFRGRRGRGRMPAVRAFRSARRPSALSARLRPSRRFRSPPRVRHSPSRSRRRLRRRGAAPDRRHRGQRSARSYAARATRVEPRRRRRRREPPELASFASRRGRPLGLPARRLVHILRKTLSHAAHSLSGALLRTTSK